MTADVHTGEIVEDLNRDEAEDCVRHILDAAAITWGWVVKAVKGRAWLALGYGSWDEMREARLSGMRLQLPREMRQEAVAELRQAGLSTRAIGTALGVSVGTIQADRSELNSRGAQEPATVTSLDGRTRPATRPAAPESPPVDLDHEMWSEQADRLTADGTVARWDAERPYGLAVVGLGHAAEEITSTPYSPDALGSAVPEHVRPYLDQIAAAHRWLGDFLTATGELP